MCTEGVVTLGPLYFAAGQNLTITVTDGDEQASFFLTDELRVQVASPLVWGYSPV